MKTSITFFTIFLFLIKTITITNAQSELMLFQTTTLNKELLSKSTLEKLEQLERSHLYKSVNFVKVGDLKKIQKGGKVIFTIPYSTDNFTYSAMRVEYSNGSDYIWMGKGEKPIEQAIFISKANKLFGSFTSSRGSFEFYTLEDGNQILLEINPNEVPIGQCGKPEIIKETEPKIKGAGRQVPCQGRVRMIALFNDRASNSVADIYQTIFLCVNQYNYAVYNSDIAYDEATHLDLAGVYYYNWDETNSYVGGTGDATGSGSDIPQIIGSSTVQSLRDDNGADIVAMFVGGGGNSTYFNPNYSSNLGNNSGVAGSIPATINTSGFVVTSAVSALSGAYVFSHELGHLLGGRHNIEDDPSAPAYAHGYRFWDGSSYVRTLMHVRAASSSENRILYFSTPQISYNGYPLGTYSTNNVMYRIKEIAPSVTNFRYPGYSSIYISGITHLSQPGYSSFEAMFQCRFPTVFEWALSSDGFNYNTLGSTTDVAYTYLSGGVNYLRCKATYGGGIIEYAYLTIYVDSCEWCREAINSTEIEVQTFPNPSQEYTILTFTTQTFSEVSYKILNIQGKVLKQHTYGNLQKGKYEKRIDLRSIPEGMYIVATNIGTVQYQNKLIITH